MLSNRAGPITPPSKLVLFALAAMMALSGIAHAQGGADVRVSIKGEPKVQKGTSTCSSDSTSQAVAVKDSYARATFNSEATAINGSHAVAFNNGEATPTNHSSA